MSGLTFGVIALILLFLGGVLQLVLDTSMAERHHSHHDTYAPSQTLIRTLLIAMVFMSILGLALTWLCTLNVFSADALVLLAFFASFVVATFVMWAFLRRYVVATYEDCMVVTPFLGPRRTVMYDDIERMEWGPRSVVGGRQSVRVRTGSGRRVTIWGLVDVQQILLRINRFDVLDNTIRD